MWLGDPVGRSDPSRDRDLGAGDLRAVHIDPGRVRVPVSQVHGN